MSRSQLSNSASEFEWFRWTFGGLASSPTSGCWCRAGTKEKYPPASQKKNSAKWVKRKKSANESKEKYPPVGQKKKIRQWVKRKISAIHTILIYVKWDSESSVCFHWSISFYWTNFRLNAVYMLQNSLHIYVISLWYQFSDTAFFMTKNHQLRDELSLQNDCHPVKEDNNYIDPPFLLSIFFSPSL